MSKNNSINFWRVIFTFSVVLYHFSQSYPKLNETFHCKLGWRLAVEFFFVVSGFLLAYKCEKSDMDEVQFLKHRFIRLFPDFLLMTAICTAFNIYRFHMGLTSALDYILNLGDDVFMLHGAAINFVNVNGATWYLSSMVICSYFIYYFYRKYKQSFSRIAAPLICLVIYSYLNHKLGNLYGITDTFTDVLGIAYSLLRGLAGISAGVISYEIYKILKGYEFTKAGKFLCGIIEFGGFISMLVYTGKYGSTPNDYLFILFFVICVPLGFLRDKKNIVLNNPVVNYLSRISYVIYLEHIFILNIFDPYLYPPAKYGEKMLLMYLAATLVFSMICEFAVSKTAAFISKKNKEHGGFIVKTKA